MNFAKVFRTPFSIEELRWLLLIIPGYVVPPFFAFHFDVLISYVHLFIMGRNIISTYLAFFFFFAVKNSRKLNADTTFTCPNIG